MAQATRVTGETLAALGSLGNTPQHLGEHDRDLGDIAAIIQQIKRITGPQRAVVTQFHKINPERLAAPLNAGYRAFVERLDSAGFVEPAFEPAPDRVQQGYRFHPRGQMLQLTPDPPGCLFTSGFLRLEAEEVPRDGIELKRFFNCARDSTGRAILSSGRSKTTGRGEGSSGLRFDIVGPRRGAD